MEHFQHPVFDQIRLLWLHYHQVTALSQTGPISALLNNWRNRMKRLGLFLLAIALTLNAAGQQSPQRLQEDPYGVNLVKYLIQSNSGSLLITEGTLERHV